MKYLSAAIAALLTLLIMAMYCGCGGAPTIPGDSGLTVDTVATSTACPTNIADFVSNLKCSGKRDCDTYTNGKGTASWKYEHCKCSSGGDWHRSWFVSGKNCGEWSGIMKWGKDCSIWLGDCFTPP